MNFAPKPPPCTRYSSHGEPCRTPTTYADRWCRECDGYTSPDPSPSGKPFIFKRRHDRPVADVPRAEEEVLVTRNAVEQFCTAHAGCSRGEAVSQIRRLLDDMLYGDPETITCSRSGAQNGNWSLTTREPYGYSLLLNCDGEVVIGYATVHAERTYAQVIEGVGSRVSVKKSRRRFAMRLAASVLEARRTEEEARERARESEYEGMVEYFGRVLARRRAAESFNGKGTSSASFCDHGPKEKRSDGRAHSGQG